MYWNRENTKNQDVLEIPATNETQAHSVWDNEGNLKFAYSCSFYLSGGLEEVTQEDYSLGLATPYDNAPLTTTQLFKKGNVAKYFIDLLGIGSGMEACSAPFNNVREGLTPNNCLIFRYFNMVNIYILY